MARPARRPEVRKLISGGQTGPDRAALDAAMELGLEHGGWCPLGRRAEDGRIAERYLLAQTESSSYSVRTERNVLDADATLILCRGGRKPVVDAFGGLHLRGGTALTRRLAERYGKPCLVVNIDQPASAARQVREWLVHYQPRVLNVAGPRESQSPGIQGSAHRFLKRLLA